MHDKDYERARAEYRLLEYTIERIVKNRPQSDIQHARFARKVYKASQMTKSVTGRLRETWKHTVGRHGQEPFRSINHLWISPADTHTDSDRLNERRRRYWINVADRILACM